MFAFLCNFLDTVIGSISCSDADDEVNASFMLDIVKGNDDSIFRLLASDLTVDGTQVDYDNMEDREFSYNITIEAIDYPVNGVSRTGVAVVVVNVCTIEPCFTFISQLISSAGSSKPSLAHICLLSG